MAETSEPSSASELPLSWHERAWERLRSTASALSASASVRRALLGMLAGTALAVALPAGWLYPYLRDDRSLDLIVRVVALDWRDFGESRARSRLEYELDHAGIGGWVKDDDCRFEREAEDRIVRCGWGVELPVPWLDVVLPLSFASEARIDSEGDLD